MDIYEYWKDHRGYGNYKLFQQNNTRAKELEARFSVEIPGMRDISLTSVRQRHLDNANRKFHEMAHHINPAALGIPGISFGYPGYPFTSEVDSR